MMIIIPSLVYFIYFVNNNHYLYNNKSYYYIYIYIYINMFLLYLLGDDDTVSSSLFCTKITVEKLGYAVDSLYPTRQTNDTIREVINI